MAMSVDGLVTGMKTTDTINQLMQVEALPQAALKTKVGVANKVVSAYQSVNTRLASLATAAKALGNADTWTSMKATSSSDAAVVTALPGAAPGSMSFRIDSLAAAHTMTFSAGSVTSASDNIMSGATLVVKLKDGSDKTLAPTDKSLETVVAAINAETDAAYRAAAVQITPGHYTLQLTAKETGATAFAGAPADIDLLGAAAITTQGTNATLTVGTTNPYSIESATNTFADVLPGVTVTAVREQAVGDPRITIGLSADVDGIAAKVQALVDNANVALSEIAAQTKGKTDVVAAGALVGDSAMRQLSQDILSVVSSGVAIGGSLNSFSSVGVELDRSGKLTFTKQTFVDAYKADPTKTQAFFDSYTDENGTATTRRFEAGWHTAGGLGRKLETVALLASEGVTLPADSTSPTKSKKGLLQGLIQRRTATISDLNDQVSAWDVRLDLRQQALQRQFTNLEVAMGKMQEQSKWLAGQLATLS